MRLDKEGVARPWPRHARTVRLSCQFSEDGHMGSHRQDLLDLVVSSVASCLEGKTLSCVSRWFLSDDITC